MNRLLKYIVLWSMFLLLPLTVWVKNAVAEDVPPVSEVAVITSADSNHPCTAVTWQSFLSPENIVVQTPGFRTSPVQPRTVNPVSTDLIKKLSQMQQIAYRRICAITSLLQSQRLQSGYYLYDYCKLII